MNNIYSFTAKMVIKSLTSTKNILIEAKKWLFENGKSEKEMLEARLAPDMFNLTKQIQTMSDNAKGMISRFTGVENPKMPDEEKNIDELIQRIEKTIDFINSISSDKFEKADQQKIILPYFPNKYQTAEDYLLDFAIPNFYFHKVTAYDILRNQGMPLNKNTYLGSLNLKDL